MTRVDDCISALQEIYVFEERRLIEIKEYLTSNNVESRENVARQEWIISGVELAMNHLTHLK